VIIFIRSVQPTSLRLISSSFYERQNLQNAHPPALTLEYPQSHEGDELPETTPLLRSWIHNRKSGYP
jgi:hypothetical protein